jgi:hypothetical protein
MIALNEKVLGMRSAIAFAMDVEASAFYNQSAIALPPKE